MLRNRVLMVAAGVLGVIALLELVGLFVGLRLEAALRRAEAGDRAIVLDLEFDAYCVRAAGEGAAAYLSGSREYAVEAGEAIAMARDRFETLRRQDTGEMPGREVARPVREIQQRILQMLGGAITRLEEEAGRLDGDTFAGAEEVFAYETLIPQLRAAMGAFSTTVKEETEAAVTRWRRIADWLAAARIAALVGLVLILARMMQKQLVVPLARLAGAARGVSEGEFGVDVPELGDAEIGELERAFNAMTRRLVAYRDETREREAQLREALIRAEAGSRSKSQFVASISHELRTPMHGVVGTADLLLSGTLGAEARARVLTIRRSAESLLVIINDVLDLARLESGRVEVRFLPIELRRVVAEPVALMDSRAMDRGLVLRHRVDEQVPAWVIGDAGRLRQVLTNLLGNAVKFTPAGRVELDVAVDASIPGGLRFEVRDSGAGIPNDALERIFEPFEQADVSVMRHHGGTGLGLAISRLLVEAMGGRIHVDSTLGSGSRFWFVIPMPETVPPPEPLVALEPVATRFSGRLLVAEDHPVNRSLAREMLAQLGCACDVVANGREAVDALAVERYDMVLMDCQMPVMDGYSATREIRRLEGDGTGRTIVVAMTAGAMESDREAACEAGMDDFLAKPFTVAELGQVLARWLEAGT